MRRVIFYRIANVGQDFNSELPCSKCVRKLKQLWRCRIGTNRYFKRSLGRLRLRAGR